MPRPSVFAVCVVAQLLAFGPGTRGQAVQTSGIISGRVEVETSRGATRAPVRRAKVVLTREGSRDSATTITDSDARFRFESLVPGRYVVAVDKPGFVSTTTQPIDVAGTTRTVDVALVPGGALEGRLQDDRNRPIPRETVTADRLGDQGGVASSHVATTDDLGRFRIHSLPAGRYRVRATPSPPASGQEHFLPGTSTVGDARLIDVAAGMTIDRLEFMVPIAPLSPIAAAAIETPQAASTATPDPKATRITGTVTRSDSGEPIANASVQLADPTNIFRHRANTGLDGRYEIAPAPHGVWNLTATAAGFVPLDAFVTRPGGGRISLTIKEGEQVKQDIALAPMSAIEGRVLDEFGDPAPGVVVQVAQKGAAVGLSRFLSSPTVGTTGTTDDRGWFRAPGLFPGDYYLILVPRPFAESWMTGFAPTFYPGTTAADAATSIPVVAGRDVFDVRFALISARAGSVTGQVVDAAGQAVPKAQILLLPVEDGEVRAMVMARTAPEANGTFRFNDVPAGHYVVQAGMGPMFGVTPVTVDTASRGTGTPTTAVKVIAKPLTTARGRMIFDGDAPAPAATPQYQGISFQPTSFTTGPVGSNRIAVKVNADWSFEIPNLAWHGVLRVNPPSGWALARIQHEGRNITDTPFDFQSADVSGLEVVLTNRVGSVSGTVMAGLRPAAKAGVAVMGADDASWTYLTRTMRNAIADDRGNFTIAALLPGRYVAVTGSADQMRLADHASLLAWRAAGVPFTVSERANTAVTLTIKPF